jgi:hypothetical protein
MSAAILPLLRTLGPQAMKTLGPLVIKRIHNLAVKELNRKVNSVTPRTNVTGLKNQIRSVINTTQLSNNNKTKLKNLLVQLKNRAQQSLIK